MVDIAEPNASLIGFALQLFATGAYCVYVLRCASIMQKKVRDGVSLWLPITCALILTITLTDLIMNAILVYQAYEIKGTEPLDPVATIACHSNDPLGISKNALIVVLGIVSDVIIVYRTFVIWDLAILMVLLPIGLLLADIALGIWAVWTLASSGSGTDPVLAAVTLRVRYFFVVTFCLNMLCAGLICWRILRVHAIMPSNVSRNSVIERPTKRALEVVVETAAIYCVHLLILIVSSSIGSNVFFIFLDPLPPVTALVFSMIIVRAQNGRTRTISGPLRSSIRFWWGDPCETASTSRDGGTAMPPGMEIHLNNVERAEMGDGKSYRSRTEVELIAPPDSKICVNC
ncbi:hypothetical protein OH76DRAFT_1561127 [Lentinus brumalis]|uniref:G-protein coupled receptors family 1 profile domain-containing protein n=1 Tax=Lentinus brumalis TaxID=2498619 RepID=A0A371CPH1_9APHY|nr:hypothetical protein OH76DRAFT_1561127 [Polyporus brumalis]